jgi:superfamily II RNA helicase
MIGRAGRRGKDNIGFTLIIPGRHQDPRLIYDLQRSYSEPLLSQIHINFSMTLNLLLSHKPPEVKDLLGRSFSTFQKQKFVSFVKQHVGEKEKGLWADFMNHILFLKETGFVDEKDRLTADGFWASKLRLDKPLLIAEAIRNGGLDHALPENLAGCLAPFVWDRTQEVELKLKGSLDISELKGQFEEVLGCIEKIRALKEKRGFDSSPIIFWPCAALFIWARGVPWERLLEFVRVDEGDMASLIMRTADHLRQIANLRDTHPKLASVADDAVELILREPVYIV